MKHLIYITICLTVLLMSCGSDNDSASHKEHARVPAKKVYTCPMHPEIIRDKPGQCPICGMDLVEKMEGGESIEDNSLKILLKPTNQYVLSKVKTVLLTEKELPVEFTATGNISYDTRMINTVTARVGGRIEKLYVKYRFQPISKGEKLMDIYSKELVTEQENYIYLLNNDSGNESIINGAENKLSLMGLTIDQIAELKRTKKVLHSITIYSPFSGHLHDIVPTKEDNAMSPSKMETQELSIHEGMYVEKGQTVFNIYCTEKVWAILNIYADRQELIKVGQVASLSIDGVRDPIPARIDFIEPTIRGDLKTITARIYLDNYKGGFKIGAIVKATINGVTEKSQFLPKNAVLNLGIRNVVFVQNDSLFEATPVQLGIRTDGWIEILGGLEKTQRVAENAQLLIDSESFVKFREE